MKIDISEKNIIRLRNVFNSILLETPEHNKFYICMRDKRLELGIEDTSIKHNLIINKE